MLTARRAREVFDYDPDTGILRWRSSPDRDSAWISRWSGEIAGTTTNNGGRHVVVDRVAYQAPRVIWLWVTGFWPQIWIDHKDGDRSNNKWDNLREATPSENQQNRAFDKRNTSGFTGVHWSKYLQAWRACISVDNHRYWASRSFSTPEEASAAYLGLKAKHHLFNPTLRDGPDGQRSKKYRGPINAGQP